MGEPTASRGDEAPTSRPGVAEPSGPKEVPTTDLPLWVANPNLLDVATASDGAAILAVGTEGTILRSTDDGESYTRVPSSTREYLNRVLVESTTGAVIVTGSGGTVLRSTDDGRSFSPIALNEGRVVTSLAQSPTSDVLVFVGDEGMAYASVDGGARFRLEPTPRKDFLTRVVALDGARRRFVAAGANGALLVREPDGTWHERDAAGDEYVTALQALPGGIVLVGLQDGRILRSTDEAERFEPVRTGVEDHYAVGFDTSPKGDVVVARLKKEPLLVSHDRGETFTATSFESSTGPAPLVWVEEGGFFGLSESGDVVRSNDQGELWTASAGGAPVRAAKLVVHPRAGTVIAVGASGFVGRAPRGARRVATVLPNLGGLIRAVAVTSSGDAIVGVGLDDTLVRSRDGGRTYERRGLSLPNGAEASALAADPRSGTLYVATTEGHVLASEDEGEHFSPAAKLDGPVHELLATPGSILALGRGFGVARARDSADFDALAVARGATLRHGVVLPGATLAMGDGGTVFRSTDDGKSFVRVDARTDATLRGAWFDSALGRLYLVGDRGTLVVSSDLGATFERLALPTTENLFCVGASDDGSTVFVGGNAGTLLRSLDRGESFVAVPTGSSQPVRVAAFDPRSRQFVIAGVGGLLMVTTDSERPRRFHGNFEGRFDRVLFHEASGGVVVVGDRLLRFELR